MAGTRTTYGPDVREAVWALACQLTQDGRIPRAEIRRRMAANDSPLGRAIELPKRTMDDMLARLIKDRGNPVQSVTQDQAPAVLDALELSVLGITRLEVARIHRKQAAGEELSPSEMTKLKTAGNTIGEMQRRRATRNNGKPQPANGAATAASPSTLTSQLAKALQGRGEAGKHSSEAAVPTPAPAEQQQHGEEGSSTGTKPRDHAAIEHAH